MIMNDPSGLDWVLVEPCQINVTHCSLPAKGGWSEAKFYFKKIYISNAKNFFGNYKF